jgi:hypothetical protein
MGGVTRLLRLAGGLLAFLFYVWVAAVRSVPRIKRRKARRRSTRAW